MDITVYTCTRCGETDAGRWLVDEETRALVADHPLVLGPVFRDAHRHGMLFGLTPVRQKVFSIIKEAQYALRQ
jgi:hypothetical protein